MLTKMIGGILLIVGTSIGAGMLALPVVTAQAGFFDALFLFLAIWVTTLVAALYILEVNLWLPETSNLVSMARATLGRWGQGFTWVVYLLLLYSLLSAYIAGGTDLLHYLFGLLHWQTPTGLDAVLFTALFGSIVFFGIRVIDWANRGLMTVKLLAFFAVILLIVSHVHFSYLMKGEYRALSSALLVAVTAFGYATVIPSLRTYFNGNVRLLRWIIILGSVISLICYLMWDLVVLGSLPPSQFAAVVGSGHAASELTVLLSQTFGRPQIQDITRLFTSICVTTSFLGVSLCLCDFLKDGMSGLLCSRGSLMNRCLPIAVALGPPLLIVLFDPALFIIGLGYAGVCCVLLLLALPAAMVYAGRYHQAMTVGGAYQVWGGRALVLGVMCVSIVLCVYGVMQLHL